MGAPVHPLPVRQEKGVPAIDNNILLDENQEVHPHMREREHFVFVNEFIWQILH